MIAHRRSSVVRKAFVGILLSNLWVVYGCQPQGPPTSGREEVQAAVTKETENSASTPGIRSQNKKMRPGRLVTQPVRTWSPSAEVIRALDLSPDQLERIRANESDYAAAMQKARVVEQRTTIRLIRNLGRDPFDREIMEQRRTDLDLATLERLRIAVDRVTNLREILELEQYRRLVDLDASAVRIGTIQPLPVIQVKVDDPASVSLEVAGSPTAAPN